MSDAPRFEAFVKFRSPAESKFTNAAATWSSPFVSTRLGTLGLLAASLVLDAFTTILVRSERSDPCSGPPSLRNVILLSLLVMMVGALPAAASLIWLARSGRPRARVGVALLVLVAGVVCAVVAIAAQRVPTTLVCD